MTPAPPRVPVALVFGLNGFLFATLFSRMPDLRSGLDLSNSALGVLLLTISLGSMSMLPTSGRVIERLGPARSVRVGAVAVVVGMIVAAVGAGWLGSRVVTGGAFFCYGLGVSLWDVAMNVEGAEVERRLGRTIMPRFHAAWSAGSITGSAIGIPMAAAHVPLLVHALVAVPVLAATLRISHSFLPAAAGHGGEAPRGSAWREPRTLLVGAMVLCFATVEGTANDWLSLAVIDGYDTPHWVGVTGFATFVAAMTTGRLVGPVLLDRVGRPAALWASSGAAAAGVLLAVYGGSLALALVGIVIWGLGAALGFPVGMSAAADGDPARAAARVSVVATIGYGAFLCGPPLLGRLGDAVGTLQALVVVAVLMVPAALAVLAARPRQAPA